MSNVTFIIYGISSDLSKRKLLPAIYRLIKEKKLKRFSIIGIASSQYSVDFLINSAVPHIKNPDLRILGKMIKHTTYVKGSFCEEETFDVIQEEAAKYKRNNIIHYLSTSPNFFEPITYNIRKKGLNKKDKNWVRIVYEKPFGFGLKNSMELNNCVTSVFKEDQIYRIDHYLGKELVKNVSVVRFSNEVLEPLWNHNHVDHIQIILNESIGIENRGKSYDKYGAVKDVIQNHVLQLLTLVTMEAPERFGAKEIRDEKFKLLKAVKRIQPKNVVLGQYDGYKKEKFVLPNSTTETFGAIKMFIDNDRWKNVPIYVKAGKKLKNKEILIYVQFKNNPCNLFPNRKKCNLKHNHLVIKVEPNEGYYMVVNSKVPGSDEITQVKMDFSHGDTFSKVNTPEAYETLLESVIIGDQSVFVRTDEIEESWRVIEDVTNLNIKPSIYKHGNVPREANHLIENDDRKWFR